jgi:CysZ protein
VSLIAFALAVALFLWALDPLTLGVQEWFATSDPSAWYGWLWVGPLRALAWMARWVLLALFAVALYVSFTIVGGVLASPFLDALSRRVERIRTGTVRDVTPPGVVGTVAMAGRIALEEGKRAAFFFGVQAALLVVGLVPGLQPVAASLAVAFAILFLPLDYAGYILDRRGSRFRDRRRWLWRNKGEIAGFGGIALLTFMIPGLNFLALPWLVTAATLLSLDLGLPEPSSS